MGVWRLALRYLFTRKIALLAVGIIAVGVMSMIVVVALMDGVQDWIIHHFKGTQSDITASPRRGNTTLQTFEDAIAPFRAENGGAIVGAGPRLIVPSLILPGRKAKASDKNLIEGIRLVGIDFDKERRVTDFDELYNAVKDASLMTPKSMRSDPLRDREGLPAILLGDSLAALLGVSPDRMDAHSGCVTVLPAPVRIDTDRPDLARRSATTFRIVGCFSSGRADYDRLTAFVDRRVLRRIREWDGAGPEASTVHLRLSDGKKASMVMADLRRRLDDWSFTSFEEARRQDLLAIQDQKRIMVVILSFIIAVAAVAIMGLVYMMVAEKMRDIGILRSMGLSRSRTVMTFTLYGFLIGLIGSVLGLLLGLYVANNLDEIVHTLSNVTGIRLLDPAVYRFKEIPVRIENSSLATIFASALAMSLLAAWLPALKAGMMTPVRCLRSE